MVSEPSHPQTLTRASYAQGISYLTISDPDLARVTAKWGNPPFWTHPGGFPGLVLAILGQQVSLESANAAFARLQETVGTVTPEAVLALDGDAMKRVGFSRQKTSYVHGLARGILNRDVDLSRLETLPDDEVRARLTRVRGIGVWTADTYLLFALRRRDAWPSGDLALAKAIEEVSELPQTPHSEAVDVIAQRWRPWRAVAARILWHHYLCARGRDGGA